MNLLQEIYSRYHSPKEYEDQEEDGIDFDISDDPEEYQEDDDIGEDEDKDGIDFDISDDQEEGQGGDLEEDPEEDLEGPDDEQEIDQVAIKSTEDPDRQGVIRPIKSAHLVYKRKTEDGTYEELWLFNTQDTVVDNMNIRKAILAGTDIPTTNTKSPDGKQSYSIWTAGNAELLNIVGLQN